jgi:hypothetical protein
MPVDAPLYLSAIEVPKADHLVALWLDLVPRIGSACEARRTLAERLVDATALRALDDIRRLDFERPERDAVPVALRLVDILSCEIRLQKLAETPSQLVIGAELLCLGDVLTKLVAREQHLVLGDIVTELLNTADGRVLRLVLFVADRSGCR